MGNWRTVHIYGSVGTDDAEKMIGYLGIDKGGYRRGAAYKDGMGALCFSEGLASLGRWVDRSGKINSTGNLAERDFTVEDVEKECRILCEKFPSLNITINCGDEYEDTKCVATIRCKDGVVGVVPPEVDSIPPISMEVMMARMHSQMYKFQ